MDAADISVHNMAIQTMPAHLKIIIQAFAINALDADGIEIANRSFAFSYLFLESL